MLEMLERRSSIVAWMLFTVCALCVAAIGLTVALAPDPASQRQLFLRLGLSVLAYPAVGALLASRQPRHPVAWTLIAIGLCFELSAAGIAYGEVDLPQYRTLPDPTMVAVLTGNLGLAGAGSVLLLFTLFPDGHYLTPRWRWLGRSCITYSVSVVVLGWIEPGPLGPAPGIVNPLGVSALEFLVPLLSRVGILLVPLGILAFASAALRFRRSTGVVRQQLKWVTAALAVLVAIVLPIRVIATTPLRSLDPTGTINSVPGAFGGIPFSVGYLTVALAIGVAILRYGLYEIDLLINRALVYGVLSALLGATYALSVLVFEAVLRPITTGSELAVALSTLAVIALFAPLRRRIQRSVDRRFYRQKYDAARTIDLLNARVRDEVDLDAIRADLLEAVESTMQPARASVWLRDRAR